MHAAVWGAVCVLPTAPLIVSCGGPGSGVVLILETNLCEEGDPGATGMPEWSRMIVTVGEDQRFCAAFGAEVDSEPGCIELGQGSFPLRLPVGSSSGTMPVPVRIELFRAGETTPVVCETAEVPVVQGELTWWQRHVERPCDSGGACQMVEFTQRTDIRGEDDFSTSDRVSCTPPEPVPQLPIARVVAGGRHACLIDAEGDVYCWGDNAEGQLARTGAFSARPRRVTLDAAATDLALGDAHTCAVVSSTPMPSVRCWGTNGNSELGSGLTSDNAMSPQQVLNSTGAVALAAGDSHTCLRTASGGAGNNVRCWGLNLAGQAGSTPSGAIAMPAAVTTGSPATWLAAGSAFTGEAHTCALLVDGTVSCWGAEDQNRLGHTGEAPMPVADPLGITPVEIAVADGSTFAVGDAGEIVAWGLNRDPGSLGFAFTDGMGEAPTRATTALRVAVPLSGDAPAHTFAARGLIACFLDDATQVPHCFGNEQMAAFHALGSDGGSTIEPRPVALPSEVSGTTFRDITVGGEFGCALPAEGMPVCWGRNNAGQRGSGVTAQPVEATVVARCQ
ncbi:MAG: RCC1 domain-containing protein [Sandaracinaceae bacterium]